MRVIGGEGCPVASPGGGQTGTPGVAAEGVRLAPRRDRLMLLRFRSWPLSGGTELPTSATFQARRHEEGLSRRVKGRRRRRKAEHQRAAAQLSVQLLHGCHRRAPRGVPSAAAATSAGAPRRTGTVVAVHGVPLQSWRDGRTSRLPRATTPASVGGLHPLQSDLAPLCLWRRHRRRAQFGLL